MEYKLFKLCKFLLLFSILLPGCGDNTDIPFPTNPLDKFALPMTAFSLTITPNPISASDPTQVWTITETNGVSFDVEQILLKTYDQNDNFIEEESFTTSEIRTLFESTYFPPDTSITGTRDNNIAFPTGYWILISIIGIDENQNPVSTAYILNIQ